MDRGKRPSEWTRCSEGFSDFKSFSSTTERVTDSKKPRKRRSGDLFRCRTTAVADRNPEVISQDILWSSSDSEDNRVSEVHLGKRKKVTKRSSPSKRKSLQVSHVASSSEAVDIVSSDTDSEKPSQELVKSSGSIKEGSIQGFESTSEEENIQSALNGQHLKTEKDGETTDSPSISGSTQSVSPPTTSTGPGVKASDWVRSLQLKTPSKSESQEETITAEDSAKKKKKHSRGGLAEQLSRLQAREKSSVRMWSHQQNKGPSSSQDNSKAISLRVLGFEVLYSIQIVKCAVLDNREDQDHKLVMFPVSQGEQLNLQIGTEVTVYPPWQQLEMNDGQNIMLCTRYCQVTYQPEGETDREMSGLSKTKSDIVTATWNCPCVQGLCKLPSTCPAFKFPSLPGLIVAKETATADRVNPHSEGRDRLTSPEKHLHTVAKKEKKSLIITNSLLESIERCSEHADQLDTGPSSVNFRGTIRRVNTADTEKENRYLLLVEDGHGAVCEIQQPGNTFRGTDLRSEAMEGKPFQFAGLRVKCRKTRDKDPSLFSLIDSVWSGTRGAVDSQDSENSVKDGKQTLTVEPPSFCYILTCEDPDNFSIKPSTTGALQSKPVMYTKLSDICTEINIKRCNCIVRILYIHHRAEGDPKHTGPTLYVTDQSLQTSPKPYIKCNITTKSNNIPVMRDCENYVLTLKDAVVDQGELSADLYTKILVETAQNNNAEATCSKMQLPLLDSTIQISDLCCVSGTISEVDEDSAYSWEACNYCSSDQLLSQPTESGDSARSVVCKNCHKQVNSPDVKMKMEILLKCTSVPNTVIRVDLLQSTIEKLLPSDEEADEGYELTAVLNKPLGPLNCVVIDCTESNRQKSVSLREIELL